MLLKALRNGVGAIIIFIDWLTRPKAITRTQEQQVQVQEVAKSLSLYQLYACPFCVKTRRALHRLNIDIDMHDIGKDLSHRQTLEEQGGRVMVPCLRIEEAGKVRWMYESSDIIAYIEQRVA